MIYPSHRPAVLKLTPGPPAAQPIHAIDALAALGGALTMLGHPAEAGRAVEAALAAIGSEG